MISSGSTIERSAFWFLLTSFTTASASGSCFADTTRVFSLIIPALFPAISPSVFPRNIIWSIPIEAITSSMVVFTTFVASSVPPSPVSSTTISQCFCTKYKNEIAVSTSNTVGLCKPSASIPSIAVFTFVVRLARESRSIISLSTWILSR